MKLHSPRKPKRRICKAVLSQSSVALALGVSLLLPACGGSSSQRSDASIGKQLSTLREAYDKGVLTREEYERERKRLVGDW